MKDPVDKDIVNETKLRQGTTSKHLDDLNECGIVISEKEGRFNKRTFK